jgi:uncharacterized protein YdiU (UPF0061 family)
VYSGHQFGVWAGQLGDGRAILLGEVATPGPLELQWKGAGLTPYSRMGDGRAVLRSSIREFLCSEAMQALGIPTTRALSVAAPTRAWCARPWKPRPSWCAWRPASSASAPSSTGTTARKRRTESAGRLRHRPLLSGAAQRGNPYAALLEEVTRRTAHMIAHWQAVGFMHGVMNTDNMSILGLTLDYGPFGFMEAFDAGHICNHTDQQGRYSYANQPQIGHWNCYALAQALLPLIGEVEPTQAALDATSPRSPPRWTSCCTPSWA